MASCSYLRFGMLHSKSVDNSSIVLNDHDENNNSSPGHFMKQNSPNCLYRFHGNMLGTKGRKIHHCRSLFPKEIHHHLNYMHLAHDKINDEENAAYHSDTDEKEELSRTSKCLPRLTQKVVY